MSFDRLKIQGTDTNAWNGTNKGVGLRFDENLSTVQVIDGQGNVAGMNFYADTIQALSIQVNDITTFNASTVTLAKGNGYYSYYGTAGHFSAEEIATRGDVYEVSIALSSEIERATSAETSLDTYVDAVSADLSSEIVRATSAETSLDTYVDAVSADLSSEIVRATSAETSLDTYVDAVSADLSSEIVRATSAETSLDTYVDAVSADLSSEIVRATSAETSLDTYVDAVSADLSSEIVRATSAETSLDTYVDNVSTTLSVEIVRVTRAFDGNSGLIATLSIAGDVNAGAFTTTSDVRLKTDIAEVSNALEMVSDLHPVFYNWADGRPTLNPGHKELGFLAQEIEAVLPSVVRTLTNGEVENQKVVAYDRVVSLLVAAVKELKAEIEAIKARMA